MVDKIESVEQIAELLVSGFKDWYSLGYVYTKTEGDFTLFSYLPQASYAKMDDKEVWSYFERVSRGLIINNKTGEIVARPFDKFYNWGEGGRKSDSPIKTVMEKMDGSLAILYRHSGNYRIATRGSFESEQALWATRFLNENFDLTGLPNELTLMFEIIYPSNRIVLDYGDKEGLVLLGARNRFTGDYLSYGELIKLANQFNLSLVNIIYNASVESLIEYVKNLKGEEGVVVEFADGQRFKFKSEEYLTLHRLVSNLSFNNTLKAKRDGLDPLADIPDEFQTEAKSWIKHIDAEVARIKAEIDHHFALAPKDDRKAYALYCKENCPSLLPYMFGKIDDKDVTPIILAKHNFKEQ